VESSGRPDSPAKVPSVELATIEPAMPSVGTSEGAEIAGDVWTGGEPAVVLYDGNYFLADGLASTHNRNLIEW